VAANERVALPLSRLRWTLLGVVLLLAIVVGILYRTIGQSATPTGAVPLSDGPAAKWAAGALRAPEFNLLDQNGAPVSLASLRGHSVLVTFIDPLCRNYCPIEAQRLNNVVRAFPQGSKPTIVAVSVNIYGNAHATLMQDARKWKLVPEWRWATGRPATLSRVWNAYHVEVLAQTKTVAGVTVHTIAHTEGAYLIDAKGYQRALFLWPYRADSVVQTLRTLSP
jgi:cytochrome oxidase Cu insertion factor (SCO1/SenC/PrrC family)